MLHSKLNRPAFSTCHGFVLVGKAGTLTRQLEAIAAWSFGVVPNVREIIPQHKFGLKGRGAPCANTGGNHVTAPDLEITSRQGQAVCPADFSEGGAA